MGVNTKAWVLVQDVPGSTPPRYLYSLSAESPDERTGADIRAARVFLRHGEAMSVLRAYPGASDAGWRVAPVTIASRLAEVLKRGHIAAGGHSPADDKMCVMEAVAYVAGEPWSDQPDCACPAIGGLLGSWNDSIDDDGTRTRVMLPLVPRLVGTRGSRHARLDLMESWPREVLAPMFETLRDSTETPRVRAVTDYEAWEIVYRDCWMLTLNICVTDDRRAAIGECITTAHRYVEKHGCLPPQFVARLEAAALQHVEDLLAIGTER